MTARDSEGRKKYLKEYRRKNREKLGENRKRHYKKLKLEVFTHYSNGTPKCNCCGEKEMSFLSLDHIGGGGNESRRKNGGGENYYYYLRNNDYPEGYQILCYNCNQATKHGNLCPHKTGVSNG